MQLPKKKNWRMPRWSITPSWSSAKASHGLSTETGLSMELQVTYGR
jgi:hypothetical protein